MSSAAFDLEAQTFAGAELSMPSSLALHEQTPVATNPVDDFFGTSSSRHDRSISEVLPPYFEEPPAYSAKSFKEPPVLAMYLFKFGFLFFPFWILGALVLASPLRIPDSIESGDNPAAWLPEKTAAEKLEIICKMRTAEIKWAKRCLYALIALLFLGVIIGVAVWVALRLP